MIVGDCFLCIIAGCLPYNIMCLEATVVVILCEIKLN